MKYQDKQLILTDQYFSAAAHYWVANSVQQAMTGIKEYGIEEIVEKKVSECIAYRKVSMMYNFVAGYVCVCVCESVCV